MADYFKATGDLTPKMNFVGARGVVHTPQFNGKQESESALAEVAKRPPKISLRCPRNGQANKLLTRFRPVLHSHWSP
jgi:hypothetical protein